MKRLCAIRRLYLPWRAPHLCALPSNRSFLSVSSNALSRYFFPLPSSSRIVSWVVLCGTVSTRLHTVPLQQLNLHSARVHRNHRGLPSSRCIESARAHLAHVHTLLRYSTRTSGPPGSAVVQLPSCS